MVLLGAAFTVASVIIFMLGMFVGKSIEERKIAKREEPLVRVPVKPEGSIKRDEVTFNDAQTKTPAAREDSPATEMGGENIARAEPLQAVEKKARKAPAEPAAKKIDTASATDGGEQARNWRAQVNAFPDERSAKLLVDRLKNKGYNAYVSEVQNRGKTWYRVSVGRYQTREEAEKVVEALQSKENYPKAFAASK